MLPFSNIVDTSMYLTGKQGSQEKPIVVGLLRSISTMETVPYHCQFVVLRSKQCRLWLMRPMQEWQSLPHEEHMWVDAADSVVVFSFHLVLFRWFHWWSSLHLPSAGADPVEVKWVNFHSPFFCAPFFLFFLSLKYWLVVLHCYKNSPPISKSWIRACFSCLWRWQRQLLRSAAMSSQLSGSISKAFRSQ